MAVPPGDVAADHITLFEMVLVVRAVQGEVAESSEVALDAVEPAGVRGDVSKLDVVGGRPFADATVLPGRQVRAEVWASPR